MKNLSPAQRHRLHSHYLLWCEDYAEPGADRASIIQSFEYQLSGLLGQDNWKAGHITPAAVVAISKDKSEVNVRRLFGVFDGVSRADRSHIILTMKAGSIEEWLPLYEKHDKCVIGTPAEYDFLKAGGDLNLDELITIDEIEVAGKTLFPGGVLRKQTIRIKTEVAWCEWLTLDARRPPSHTHPGMKKIAALLKGRTVRRAA